jgi:hypothetical protein
MDKTFTDTDTQFVAILRAKGLKKEADAYERGFKGFNENLKEVWKRSIQVKDILTFGITYYWRNRR